jgi:glutamate racemase
MKAGRWMQAEKAVGVFDSGVGGLSVLSQIRKYLPGEHLVYVADSAYIPYGCKTSEDVRDRCLLVAKFLLNQNIKALVVACNTATSMAVHTLRTELDIPVIGMEPPVKPAVHGSREGVVGVLATSGTLNSDRFNRLRLRFAVQAELFVQPCPGLVELIEQGDLQTDQMRNLLASYLQPLLDEGVDTLVLGCTHYPFILPLIRQIAGDSVSIVDTGDAIARELKRQLHTHSLLSENHQDGEVQFWSTGDTVAVQPVLSCLWGEKISLNSIDDF